MSEENELPSGWLNIRLEDICTIIMGQSPPSSEYNEDGEGLPFFQGKAEFTDLFPEVRKWCAAPTKIADANDILLSIRAPVGPTNLAPSLCCIGRGLAAIRPANDIQVRYVLYAIRAFISSLTELGTGTTFAAVSSNDVRAFEIPLAPTNEQHRIVAAIEQQFTRLDAGVAALQSAKTKLKRYRAAILKAAVEGKLTQAWRAGNPTTEPATTLLERILKERRARWEADLRAKGKDPEKVKYIEPAAPEVVGLPELPEGWCYAFLIPLLSTTRRGITTGPFGSLLMKHEHQLEGIPVLGIENIEAMKFILGSKIHLTKDKARQLSKYDVQIGDVLISRSGTVGEVCVVPDGLGEARISTNLMRVVLAPNGLFPQFFCLLFNGSPFVLSQISELCKGSTRDFLNQNILSSIIFPLPPLAEQEQIVAEVERRLSVISQLEVTVEASLKRAERLRQSILREAFAGRLVPQDPDDEPASVLLERIRSERTGAQKNGSATNKNHKSRPLKVPQPEILNPAETEQVELWENIGG